MCELSCRPFSLQLMISNPDISFCRVLLFLWPSSLRKYRENDDHNVTILFKSFTI